MAKSSNLTDKELDAVIDDFFSFIYNKDGLKNEELSLAQEIGGGCVGPLNNKSSTYGDNEKRYDQVVDTHFSFLDENEDDLSSNYDYSLDYDHLALGENYGRNKERKSVLTNEKQSINLFKSDGSRYDDIVDEHFSFLKDDYNNMPSSSELTDHYEKLSFCDGVVGQDTLTHDFGSAESSNSHSHSDLFAISNKRCSLGNNAETLQEDIDISDVNMPMDQEPLYSNLEFFNSTKFSPKKNSIKDDPYKDNETICTGYSNMNSQICGGIKEFLKLPSPEASPNQSINFTDIHNDSFNAQTTALESNNLLRDGHTSVHVNGEESASTNVKVDDEPHPPFTINLNVADISTLRNPSLYNSSISPNQSSDHSYLTDYSKFSSEKITIQYTKSTESPSENILPLKIDNIKLPTIEMESCLSTDKSVNYDSTLDISYPGKSESSNMNHRTEFIPGSSCVINNKVVDVTQAECCDDDYEQIAFNSNWNKEDREDDRVTRGNEEKLGAKESQGQDVTSGISVVPNDMEMKYENELISEDSIKCIQPGENRNVILRMDCTELRPLSNGVLDLINARDEAEITVNQTCLKSEKEAEEIDSEILKNLDLEMQNLESISACNMNVRESPTDTFFGTNMDCVEAINPIVLQSNLSSDIFPRHTNCGEEASNYENTDSIQLPYAKLNREENCCLTLDSLRNTENNYSELELLEPEVGVPNLASLSEAVNPNVDNTFKDFSEKINLDLTCHEMLTAGTDLTQPTTSSTQNLFQSDDEENIYPTGAAITRALRRSMKRMRQIRLSGRRSKKSKKHESEIEEKCRNLDPSEEIDMMREVPSEPVFGLSSVRAPSTSAVLLPSLLAAFSDSNPSGEFPGEGVDRSLLKIHSFSRDQSTPLGDADVNLRIPSSHTQTTTSTERPRSSDSINSSPITLANPRLSNVSEPSGSNVTIDSDIPIPATISNTSSVPTIHNSALSGHEATCALNNQNRPIRHSQSETSFLDNPHSSSGNHRRRGRSRNDRALRASSRTTSSSSIDRLSQSIPSIENPSLVCAHPDIGRMGAGEFESEDDDPSDRHHRTGSVTGRRASASPIRRTDQSVRSSISRSSYSNSEHSDWSQSRAPPPPPPVDGFVFPKRVLWPHPHSGLMASLPVTLNMFNISRFAVMGAEFGWQFPIQWLVISLVLGLPLMSFHAAIGHFLGASVVDMWIISPIFKGIGYSLILVEVVLGIYCCVPIAWLFTYFRDSFDPGHFRCFSAACDTSYNLTRDINEYVPGFFSSNVLQRSDENSPLVASLGSIKFDLCFNIALNFIITFLALSRGTRSYGKICYLVFIVPFICFLSICFYLAYWTKSGLDIMRYGDRFLDRYSWMAASREAFLVWGLHGAVIQQMAASNKKRHPIWRDTTVLVLLTFIGLGLASFCGLVCVSIMQNREINYRPSSFENAQLRSFVGVQSPTSSDESGVLPYMQPIYDNFYVGIRIRDGFMPSRSSMGKGIYSQRSGYNPLRFLIELFPALMFTKQDQIMTLWQPLFYLSMLLFGLAQQLSVWHCVVQGVVRIYPERLQNWETFVAFCCCLIGFSAAVPLATGVGIHIIYFLDYLVGSIWWIMILQLLMVFAVLFVRGKPCSAQEIARRFFGKKRGCSISWITTPLSFSWTIMVPVGLLVLSITSFKTGNYREVFAWESDYWSELTCQLSSTFQLFPLLLVPIVGFIQTCRYMVDSRRDMFERIQHLYRPPRHTPPPQSVTNNPLHLYPHEIEQAAQGSSSDETRPRPFTDPPPKYTPPPSYSTATGVGFAKSVNQSLRRSLRCLRSTLSDSSRRSTSNDTENQSTNDSNRPYIPTPDYSSSHQSQSTRVSEHPPPPTYATLDPLTIRNILRIASNSQIRRSILGARDTAKIRGTVVRATSIPPNVGQQTLSTVDGGSAQSSTDSELEISRSNFRRSTSFNGNQLRRSLTSGIRRSARRFVDNLRANTHNQGMLVSSYNSNAASHESAANLTVHSEA